MVEFNAALFSSYEKMFLVLKRRYSEDEALDNFRALFEEVLTPLYDTADFEKGNPNDFVRVVGERDKNVGLDISFPEVTATKIVYRFNKDPFENLRGLVDHRKFDDTYMNFKVAYLLGSNWTYRTTKHFWDGDEFTEHVITKK